MEAYTDYPFTFLGDEPYKEAPIRKCRVINYDGNKYCQIIVEGIQTEVKSGYLYKVAGRCGEVNRIDVRTLPRQWDGDAETFGHLYDMLEKIKRVATGEDQVADDDTDGLAWIADYITKGLGSV